MIVNDLQAEKDVIWLLIENPENVPAITSQLSPDDFYHIANKNNFILSVESYKKDGIVDIHKIEKIYEYGRDSHYVSALWIPRLVKQLKECSKKRMLSAMVSQVNVEIEKKGADELIRNSMELLTKASSEVEVIKTDAHDIALRVAKSWKDSQGKELIGLSCGYFEIDEKISGMRPGHVWIVGGYTNYGKTTLAISFLVHLMKSELSFLFCSIEMSQEEIFEKIVANLTRQTANWNRRNYNLPMVQDAMIQASKGKIEITDHISTVEGIVLKVQEMAIRGIKPAVVFIDFIQNLGGKGTEYERITNNIRELQQAAKRLKICFVVLSQVNNQSAGTTEVMGFKGSGALPAAGDLTIQIVRSKTKEIENAKNNAGIEIVDMELLIQKNRHGRGGIVKVDFNVSKGLIVGH